MTIKKLQPEKKDKSLILKFIIVLLLLVTGIILSRIPFKKKSQDTILGAETKQIDLKETGKTFEKIIDQGMDKAKKSMDDVLGEATSFVTDTASRSTEIVTDFIFDNTVGSIVKQINKLPEKQQEEIKERVCK